MKIKKIPIINIILFTISLFILEKIVLNQEFTYNYYNFILINIFRVHKIFPQPDYGMTHIFFYSILLFSILNYIFSENKVYLIINQVFLGVYLILNLYPTTIGRAGFEDGISMMYFIINIFIIILLHLINIYQLKQLKN
ncbi:hypothetical protein [Parvimonas micra]|uniref:Uncharacterized protein n=1 Tax=Parvimonas micra TaxID=33033 RepID=A0A9X3K8H0_9FIRM|nr:hypothetical protein [Parvimonas micra]MCZ7406833.1 hypothetical protein [Parvimonas micra]MCZ7411804.1 hypothetical protein [Parvimonas micra]WBB37708.1 hypothetical protein NM218_03745 [Parvimonas micra]